MDHLFGPFLWFSHKCHSSVQECLTTSTQEEPEDRRSASLHIYVNIIANMKAANKLWVNCLKVTALSNVQSSLWSLLLTVQVFTLPTHFSTINKWIPWSQSRPQCWSFGTDALKPFWFQAGRAAFPHSYEGRPQTAGIRMGVDWPWPLV